MRSWTTGRTAAAAFLGAMAACSVLQTPTARSLDEKTLREYTGVYQWGPNAFVYLQILSELEGTSQLAALDESGEIRTLYSADRNRFFAGPGLADSSAVESRVEFQRDKAGKVISLMWHREGAPARIAQRAYIEEHENVRFSSGGIELAGTLIRPATDGPHPAIILVHGSGPANRESVLPFARLLVRHGIAVLGYDKRGVGGSTGDWNTASFEDLAGDVVAAFEYLKTRGDIDSGQIGLLGVSQAGWIMPLAAVRAKDIAFLISISGAGVPAAETTIDHARNEMSVGSMPSWAVERTIRIMKLQYRYAQTGEEWDEYISARGTLFALMLPAETFPATPDHPYWQLIRRLYFYDPAPTLRKLQTPTLALFGELDNNIMAQKNKAAWEAALSAGGNPDYTLRILPKANHIQLEAAVGNNAEIASLRRFAPDYFPAIRDWLAKRIPGFGAPD